MIENELSFLVARMPALAPLKKKRIEQHYLSDGREPLRIRHTEGAHELTKKLTMEDGDLSRLEEITIPLTPEEYAMLKTHAKKSLEKTRYYHPLPGGLTAEIDVFGGALDGLVMAEVEFPDEATRTAFVPPDWFGADVSQEEWSRNSWLAGKSMNDVRPHLP
jgi:adenylate cyclase